MTDFICGRTMARCYSPGMCAPYGGCLGTTAVKGGKLDQLRAEVERLEAFCAFHRGSAEAWHKCFRAAETERDQSAERASYWKQRAKSAEGHLWASDFQAACDALHAASNYADISWEKLTVAQKAHISHAVSAVLGAVNTRRDGRRPADDAGEAVRQEKMFAGHFAGGCLTDNDLYIHLSSPADWPAMPLGAEVVVHIVGGGHG